MQPVQSTAKPPFNLFAEHSDCSLRPSSCWTRSLHATSSGVSCLQRTIAAAGLATRPLNAQVLETSKRSGCKPVSLRIRSGNTHSIKRQSTTQMRCLSAEWLCVKCFLAFVDKSGHNSSRTPQMLCTRHTDNLRNAPFVRAVSSALCVKICSYSGQPPTQRICSTAFSLISFS